MRRPSRSARKSSGDESKQNRDNKKSSGDASKPRSRLVEEPCLST
jgi:hypothetical protein